MEKDKETSGFYRMELHLDGITDPTLIVLKTHLLVEEALFIAVQDKLEHPKFINEARLSFFQLLNLAKAFYYKEKSSEVWMAIESMNTVRNKLAHRLDVGDISISLEKMCCIVPLPYDFSIEHPCASMVLSQTAGFLIAFSSSLRASGVSD